MSGEPPAAAAAASAAGERLLYRRCPADGRHAIPHAGVRAGVCVRACLSHVGETKNTAGHDGMTKKIGLIIIQILSTTTTTNYYVLIIIIVSVTTINMIVLL